MSIVATDPTLVSDFKPHSEVVEIATRDVAWLDRLGKRKVDVDFLLTVYRLVTRGTSRNGQKKTLAEVPLPCIDSFESRKVGNEISIHCKDLRVLDFQCKTAELHTMIVRVLKQKLVKNQLVSLHALTYKKEHEYDNNGWLVYDPILEYQRQGLGRTKPQWRISEFNAQYAHSQTYPKIIAVPEELTDNTLILASKERTRNRIPALVWLSPESDASLSRSSQPILVGSTTNDYIVIKSIQDTNKSKSLWVVDARPKTNALANMAIGGGYEQYQKCKVLFMNIDNIHVMRESYAKLKDSIISSVFKRIEDPTHVSDRAAIEGWLEHAQSILLGAIKIVHWIIDKKRSVLVHCSDGWDRTPQLTATACLIMDPYYRTIKGFQVLIEKEWCSFGHKFSERNGHVAQTEGTGSSSERSPVFLQWLDVVFQIMQQHPFQFEFNEYFLICIMENVYSCKFGTFLFDSEETRNSFKIRESTASLWSYTNDQKYVEKYANPFYSPDPECLVLPCSADWTDLQFWKSYYLRWWGSSPIPANIIMASKFNEAKKEIEHLRLMIKQSGISHHSNNSTENQIQKESSNSAPLRLHILPDLVTVAHSASRGRKKTRPFTPQPGWANSDEDSAKAVGDDDLVEEDLSQFSLTPKEADRLSFNDDDYMSPPGASGKIKVPCLPPDTQKTRPAATSDPAAVAIAPPTAESPPSSPRTGRLSEGSEKMLTNKDKNRKKRGVVQLLPSSTTIASPRKSSFAVPADIPPPPPDIPPPPTDAPPALPLDAPPALPLGQ